MYEKLLFIEAGTGAGEKIYPEPIKHGPAPQHWLPQEACVHEYHHKKRRSEEDSAFWAGARGSTGPASSPTISYSNYLSTPHTLSSVYLRCKKCNCYYIYWRGQSAAVIFLVEDRLSGIPADHCCLGTRQQHLGFNCSQSGSQATVNK